MAVQFQTTSGRGRALVLIHETAQPHYQALASELSSAAALPFGYSRAVICGIPEVRNDGWKAISQELAEGLAGHEVRQALIVAFGQATAIAQHYYHSGARGIRGLILVDPTCRARPTVFEKSLSFLERRLPLGLPFKHASDAFDGMPFLHRVRCPVALVSSVYAIHETGRQVAAMASAIPTAWSVKLSNSVDQQPRELIQIVSDFSSVPAKCPQKGTQRETAGTEKQRARSEA